MPGGLLLRDVHAPPAPPLWPPAPGWWLLASAVAVAATAWWWLRRRRRHRVAAALGLFDAEIARASSSVERLAAASELLRRASRRLRADADRLEGDAWLDWLDSGSTRFSEGPGRLLVDGAFRRDVDVEAAERAVALARARFVALMGTRG